MKVGDWVLVTPDEFDIASRGVDGPILCRILKNPYDSLSTNPTRQLVRVKPLFCDTDWDMYVEQCVVVAHSEVEDASQSDPT